MASPFSIFRKNRTAMLAVLTLLAMFGFVFLPIIMQGMGGKAAVNPVVVKTAKFGNLTQYDLQMLQQRRRRIAAVLSDVFQAAGQNPAMIQSWLSPTEEAVVNTWLLARYAEQMGLVVSDARINTFLKSVTGDRVAANVFQTAFKRSQFSDVQFFNAIRDDLAAMELQRMFDGSVDALTPAQRWQYFSRVNRMAKIEAAAVPVANYADRVPDPPEEELKAFFEKHKEQYARPDSPEPGFREPQKVALEYLKADTEKLMAAVTEDEIKERYEKNKDSYDELEKSLAPPKPGETKPSAEKPVTETPGAAKPADEKPAAEVKKKPPEEKPKDGAKEETPAAEKPKDAAKEEAPAAEKPKEPEKADKDKETGKDKDTSAVGQPSPFRLTAFAQEQPASEPAAKESDAPKASEPAAKEEKPAEKPAAPAAEAQPAAKPAEPVKEESKPAEQPKPAATDEKPAEKIEPATPPEKPAEKRGLTDVMKKRVRKDIADEKFGKMLQSLRESLDQYHREWQKYDAERIRQQALEAAPKGQKAPTPPPRPDFETLAKENGLTAGHTGLLAQWQLRETEIGSAFAGRQMAVWQAAYTTLPLFSPELSGDLKGNIFLFWKTEDVKERTPSFDDEGVRKQVLRTWKLIKAREPALAEAKSLAAEAGKKDSLKQALADRSDLTVVTPPPFSWITFGNVPLGSAPNAARISNVEGLDMPGEAFMKTVFGLDPGQAGEAMNAPETVAYVVRVTTFSPPFDELWRRFEVDDFNTYAPAAAEDRQKASRALLQEIKTSAGLQWATDRKPVGPNEQGPSIPMDDYE